MSSGRDLARLAVRYLAFLIPAIGAAVILVVYVSEIPDRPLLSAFFLFGFIAAVLLLLYIVMRRIVEPKWGAAISSVAESFIKIKSISREKGAIKQKVEEVKKQLNILFDQFRPAFRILFTALVINGIVLLLVGLSNALVMYLQVKRLDVQNSLLENQNKLLESQTTFTKYQSAQDVGRFLSESYAFMESINRNTTSLIDYGRRLAEIRTHIRMVTSLSLFEGVYESIPQCSDEFPGCITIDSLGDSVIDQSPYVDSVEELLRLYIVSVFIWDVYNKLHAVFETHLNKESGVSATGSGESGRGLSPWLNEAIRVCGLVEDSNLTAHKNYDVLDVVVRMEDLLWTHNLFIQAWEYDNISVDIRAFLTDLIETGLNETSGRLLRAENSLRNRSLIISEGMLRKVERDYDSSSIDIRLFMIDLLEADLNDTVDQLENAGHPVSLTSSIIAEKSLQVFGRSMELLSDSVDDLNHQCWLRSQANIDVINLLTEHAARSVLFLRSLQPSDVTDDPVTRIPLDFYEAPLLDMVRGFVEPDSGSNVIPPGLRVDADHVTGEGGAHR